LPRRFGYTLHRSLKLSGPSGGETERDYGLLPFPHLLILDDPMNQRPLPAYRLAALDLDETLLGHDRAVSPRNAAAVRLLKERGLYVVIASGRMYASTYRFAEPLGLEDPIISYNGAMASWPARGEVFHHLTIPADVAAAVARLCAEEGHHLNYYLDDRLYVRELTEWSDLYHFRTGSRCEPVRKW
jgi:hydroxymethylpyrimidine pyrophosphatase-like HAD family hydrolase